MDATGLDGRRSGIRGSGAGRAGAGAGGGGTAAGTPFGISLAGGAVQVVAGACLAAAIFPPTALAGRLVLLALVVGSYAAAVADLRATATVTALAGLLFIGFLDGRFGELAWYGGTGGHLLVLAFAAVLGRGQRWIRSEPAGGPRPLLPGPRTVRPVSRESVANPAAGVTRDDGPWWLAPRHRGPSVADCAQGGQR